MFCWDYVCFFVFVFCGVHDCFVLSFCFVAFMRVLLGEGSGLLFLAFFFGRIAK